MSSARNPVATSRARASLGRRRRAATPSTSPTTKTEPVIVDVAELAWETWPDELVAERGTIFWKTLLSGDRTPSDALTLGIARLPPGEALHEHHHAQAELYFVLDGAGEVTIDGESRSVGAGTAVF